MGTINHVKTSAIADDTNTSLVRPSDWNSAHAYTLVDGISLSGNNTLGVLAPISSGTCYLAGGNNVTLSQNGNSITIEDNPMYCGWLEPYSQTNTALFAPGAGSWYFAPFIAPAKMSGGRINFLQQNTSTGNLFLDVGNTAYVSSSTGTLNQSYTYSKAVALYSQGAGTNSTRLESLWSNSFSFGWSKILNVSTNAASNIAITIAHSLSYISNIGSDGAYTLNQFASAISSTIANSSGNSTAVSNAASSIRNMLSNSVIFPIGFNTTINPGAYWLAFAWSSTRATASTGGLLGSASDFSVSSDVGISRLVLESAYRNWGSTVTTARSHIMPYGLFTGVANMAPPATLAFSSDLSSIASAWVPYFNFQLNNLTK